MGHMIKEEKKEYPGVYATIEGWVSKFGIKDYGNSSVVEIKCGDYLRVNLGKLEDFERDQILPGAKVSFNGKISIFTKKDGTQSLSMYTFGSDGRKILKPSDGATKYASSEEVSNAVKKISSVFKGEEKKPYVKEETVPMYSADDIPF